MNIVTQILLFFENNIAIVSFLGAIIGGEETLIFLTILATREFFNLWLVFIFFFLGVTVSDMFWYFAGKSKIFDWLVKTKFISNAYYHWGRLLDKATRKSDFQALLVTKFLYGFRLPTIMYLARERLLIPQFLVYTLFTNLLWTGIIMSIAWVIGKGIITAKYFTNSIVLDLFLIGLVLILFIVIMRVLSKKTKQWLEK